MNDFLLKIGLVKLINKSNYSLASIDTRNIVVGQIFFALPGRQYDGNNFVQVAAAKGAIAAVVSKAVDNCIIPQIVVPDVRKCLVEYAAEWRKLLTPVALAITGSNGKTTTRAMVQHVLEKLNQPSCATIGNYNNDLGLSLSMLKLRDNHKYAVFELGASGPNEISALAELTIPTIGVITNISECHLDGFKDIDGVVKAKAELFTAMNSGKAIINVDSYGSRYFHAASEHLKTISFGKIAPGVDFGIGKIVNSLDNSIIFELNYNLMKIEVRLQVAGVHNVYNACAAIALLVEAGLDIRQVVAAIETFTGVAGRLAVSLSAKGYYIIDDTYNASPASFAVAINFLKSHVAKNKWIVCADMAELSDSSDKFHEQVLTNLAENNINIIAYGKRMHKAIKKLAIPGHIATSIQQLQQLIDENLKYGDVLLVKGSRFMQLQRLVDNLKSDIYA